MRVRKDTPEYMLKYSHLPYSSKEYQQAYRRESKRNPATWLTKTYSRIKRDNLNKFGLELSFSKEEFKKWAFEDNEQVFNDLFKRYIESDFNKHNNPSVDRIDDYDSYRFSNMQLISWQENDKLGSQSLKNRISCSEMSLKYNSKRVMQYTLNGDYVSEYPSAREAARKNGICSSSISKVCRNVQKTCGGYIWRYANE